MAQVSDASLRLFILPIFTGLYFTGLSFISKMNCKLTDVWIICCPHVTPQGLFLGTRGGELIAITSFCKNLLFVQIKWVLSLWAPLWKKLVKKCHFPGFLYQWSTATKKQGVGRGQKEMPRKCQSELSTPTSGTRRNLSQLFLQVPTCRKNQAIYLKLKNYL